MDIIHSGESMAKCVSDSAKERMPAQGVCKRCGYISSMDVCKVRERRVASIYNVCAEGGGGSRNSANLRTNSINFADREG